MPKIKTLKILTKKIKITKNKFVKRRKTHRSHLMSKRRNIARKRSKRTLVEAIKVSTLGKLIKAFNLTK